MTKTTFSIYNASAGSGKTYMLVKEYLKIVLLAGANDAYRKILAITFTNKAVEEMKGRIIFNLSDFSKDDPTEKGAALMKVLAQETGLFIATIKDKSKAIIKNIIHNYASFDISTIDRFTHKVIRAFAHDLNLSVSFDVSLETENLLKEAVDAIIAKAGENEQLTNLLVDFSLDKTDNDKSWDVTYELFETGKLLINENNRNELNQFKEKTIDEFITVKEKLQKAVEHLDAECVTLGNNLNAMLQDAGIDPKSFSGQYFPKHIGYIIKGELKSTHKKYREAEDIKINKTAKDRDAIEAIIPQLLATLQEVYNNYEKKNFYEAFLKNITPLSLLNSIGQELERIQKDQNVLSISEFNAIIHKEIQNQPAPFIYERLGERYRHFFIDEFQDTSQMQWQNLIPLIDNALSSEDMGVKGSLMLVGDPKQSIYRWRGGKAEQFIDLSKGFNPFANPDKQVVDLETNFRSYSTIIDFNNDFFSMLSGIFQNEDYTNMYRNSKQKHNPKQGGYANVAFVPEVDTTDEDAPNRDDLYLEATLDTIQKVKAQGFMYKDIVLLTRKRQPGVQLANYLTEQGIPILSSETLLIENATEVKLILNLLRYLKSNDNKEAKAHFLYFVANTRQMGEGIHHFIAEGMEQPTEEALEKWLSGYDIHISFKGCRKKSLYEAVETIVDAFIKEKANQSYVQYFLDLVLERDIRTQSGIADFLTYWDANGSKFSIPSPEGNDAVRIMTIHKAKGLEFPVVIFPFAEEDYARAPRSKMWLELEDETFGIEKALIDRNKSVADYGERGAALYTIKEQEELLDNINILYVALTRAEEQLYIISARNIKANGELTDNMSSFFIQYLQNKGVYADDKNEYEFGNPKRLSVPDEETQQQPTIQVVQQRLNPQAVKIAQREALMWGSTQLKAIAFGNVMHEILAFVKTPDDIPLAVTKAVESGLITQGQNEEVTHTLNEIVNHPDLSVFFIPDATVYNEQRIIGLGMQTIKPDRVTVSNGKAYLLDYKTGAHQAKYEKQLDGYQSALQQMGLQVAKKTLVYIGAEINVVNLPV
ncbi:ATP-dependent helicase [Flavobacterium arcticum]|uniref:DNA 3'-5' helicase n=1 Tax=Flavobacterium arcticum TaxID=1784713 RepID=A0A345HBP8_9FLAO|nr:UvrD-helicase domain-containing protein [Flavobacterium arcticum]AXG74008.1 ATP-dependent helicase [Flavobacterium arcticum]KAF2508986.1 UvrD-helicase domain-containing protein [Flavobacterium arcticum]